MTTLKERFEETFACKEKGCCDGLQMADHFKVDELCSFFRQELLAMAEEVEAKTPNPDHTVGGIKHVAAFIRSKADELN